MNSSPQEVQYIVDYIADQAHDQTVEHLEKVASECVYGRRHDVWDVHTDKERWWVITNPTNLYSQTQFPSMDIVISFHIGLMARVLSRSGYGPREEGGFMFASAWRSWEQAEDAFENADEAEEFQSIGMRCRESLIAFVKEAAKSVPSIGGVTPPKASDFVNWSVVISDLIAAGSSAERRRGYLKSIAKSAWELVNWLTHASNATRFDAHLAVEATGHVLSTLTTSFVRFERGAPERCPQCGSYKITSERFRDENGERFKIVLCTVCDWESEPPVVPEVEKHSDASSEENNREVAGDCVVVEVPLRGPKPPKPSIS